MSSTAVGPQGGSLTCPPAVSIGDRRPLRDLDLEAQWTCCRGRSSPNQLLPDAFFFCRETMRTSPAVCLTSIRILDSRSSAEEVTTTRASRRAVPRTTTLPPSVSSTKRVPGRQGGGPLHAGTSGRRAGSQQGDRGEGDQGEDPGDGAARTWQLLLWVAEGNARAPLSVPAIAFPYSSRAVSGLHGSGTGKRSVLDPCLAVGWPDARLLLAPRGTAPCVRPQEAAGPARRGRSRP